MNHLMEIGLLAAIILIGLFTIGLVFARLYRRSIERIGLRPHRLGRPESGDGWRRGHVAGLS